MFQGEIDWVQATLSLSTLIPLINAVARLTEHHMIGDDESGKVINYQNANFRRTLWSLDRTLRQVICCSFVALHRQLRSAGSRWDFAEPQTKLFSGFVGSNRFVYFAVFRSDLNCWWHNGVKCLLRCDDDDNVSSKYLPRKSPSAALLRIPW